MHGEQHPKKAALHDAREAVVARLTDAFARDEIGLEAFERRINDAYGAASIDVLDALIADLGGSTLALATVTAEIVPAEIVAPRAEIVRASTTRSAPIFRAILGSVERSGTLTIAENARVMAVLGSLELDLRDAVLPPGLTEIHVRSVLGSIEITVPADVAVECEGVGILGSFEGQSHAVADLDPDAPRLRIVGSAVLGSIEIHSRPPTRVAVRVEELRARKLLPR